MKDVIQIDGHGFKSVHRTIVAGFGDIHNFAPWAKRASTTIQDFKKFVTYSHKRFLDIRREGFYVKLLADGLMFIKELPEVNECRVVTDAIDCAIRLNADMESQIKTLHFPRPDGFRVRIAIGDALKLRGLESPKDPAQTEYVGYIVNLAFRLLEIQKKSSLICHESVKAYCEEKIPYNFTKLVKPAFKLPGVDDEDLDALWEVAKHEEDTDDKRHEK